MELVDIGEVEAILEDEKNTAVLYRDGRTLRADEAPLTVLDGICRATGKSLFLLAKVNRQFGALRVWEKPGLVCLAPMLFFVPVPVQGRKTAFVNLARSLAVFWHEDMPVIRLQSGREIRALWNLSQFGKRWKNALDVRERYLSLCRHQLALADILHA